ncbi:unnamed protein product [Rotaria magnacalcarata]|uniref:Uncharacterized protein n=1 Tax=Rotaria magnacalcarata TaxID=392030 RepID=A0A815UG29_9BILA|nr:unnamed protein product [Rotaria magnacalcarata]CAF2035733.1 unnamed protein product [Rotaria magnacalcarata]CAF3790599.1 unnamed protein product [Rotaria magnacalcarata]CAF3815361.1 unnamed protein product [Rotaria magnacalcarata]CAF3821608.1 unnamed protein product [Rotaria magnacalcarata]
MTSNGSQIGNTPLESRFENHGNASSIDQLLFAEVQITNEPSIELNPTNMIPSQIPIIYHHQEQQYIRTRSQEGRRRRRQRQRQRRRERREAIRRQQQQQQQRQRQEQRGERESRHFYHTSIRPKFFE